jgi:hypothetical protein
VSEKLKKQYNNDEILIDEAEQYIDYDKEFDEWLNKKHKEKSFTFR